MVVLYQLIILFILHKSFVKNQSQCRTSKTKRTIAKRANEKAT